MSLGSEDEIARMMFGEEEEDQINLLEERVSTSRIEDIMFGKSESSKSEHEDKNLDESKSEDSSSSSSSERFEEKNRD